MTKTNAMRRLDAAKIQYEVKEYEVDESDLSGVHIASQIGLPFEQVFKTLTAKGDKTGVIVFCIPCHKEIDLKKAAAVTGNKRVELLAVKDLLATTGYVRGGCSPIGMKKNFPTFIEESALEHEKITVSAGMKGAQLLLNVSELVQFVGAKVCQIV
jgi:Cys-tRNA(Pro)/Cys-tRNA(Cys) deacylase